MCNGKCGGCQKKSSDSPNNLADANSVEEKEYTVTWTIQVSATSPEEAAHFAREIQEDPESVATVFTVRETERPNMAKWTVEVG